MIDDDEARADRLQQADLGDGLSRLETGRPMSEHVMSEYSAKAKVEEIAQLRPGDPHYMAYVGPPTHYDFMGATQFRLLCALGLRAHHTLLDFGCGSLRAGRFFLTYLDPGN